MRHAATKFGAAKTAALATTVVTVTAGITASVVVTNSPKPAPPNPVVAKSASAGTSSAAPTTSASPSPSPSPSPSATPLVLGVFANTWRAHFGVLKIAPDGTFTVNIFDVTKGTYTSTGTITSATATTADGTVTKTDYAVPHGIPLGPVHLTFDKDTGSVDFIQGADDRGFCGDTSPAGFCGA